MHVHNWPGSTVAVGGLKTKVMSAKLFNPGTNIEFKQEEFRVQFMELPESAPEQPVTTLAAEFDGEPLQGNTWTRRERPRRGVGV